MGTDHMHADSIRAWNHRHRQGARTAALLVAAFFLILLAAIYGPDLAHSETITKDVATLENTAIPPAGVAQEIAIATVPPGQEGLELWAKLEENGGFIERPIAWTITTSTGETVYSVNAPSADAAVPPGDYMIDIRYGASHYQKGLTLLEGNHLAVSFVLNVGGIRVLPRIKDLGLPAAPSLSRVFVLGGINAGELVAQSSVPGEIIRVPAGSYRVESRFESGNALAVADVKVKPGLMSAVEIDHAAGLARLSFVGAPDAEVSWSIATTSGENLVAATGLATGVVLKPGSYVASATAGGEVMTATFAIAAGEERDIILGN